MQWNRIIGLLTCLTIGIIVPAHGAAVGQYDPATITVVHVAPDGVEVGKAAELSDGNAGTSWQYRPADAEKDLPLRIVLTLDAPRVVGKVRIANYYNGGQSSRRSWKQVDLFVGDNMAPVTGGTPAVADVEVKPGDATGTVWTDIVLPKPLTGRCVTLRVKSNGGASYYGANEVELYADAADASTPVKTTPPPTAATPTVSSSVVMVNNRKYAVYEFIDPATKRYCLVIPEGMKTVRGLLVVANYFGGDSRGYWTDHSYYREFMHLHDFAYVGATGDCSHNLALQGFRNCLQLVSTASKHPELVNAPYVATGLSAGGGFASTLMTREPEKTIAVGIICARYNFEIFDPTKPAKPGDPPHQLPTGAFLDALLSIPSILITGELEHLNDNPDPNDPNPHKVDDVFITYRPKGGELAWLECQGHGHQYNENRQDVLAMPLLDLAVRTRYPRNGDPVTGPIKLLRIDPADGWVADNTTWKSGLTKIVPAKQFTGDVKQSSWLQNEDIAFIYRAYATYDNPLTITAPGPCGPGTPAIDPGSNMSIVVDDTKFPGWKKLEFYDDAKKLGEITQGPPQLTAKNLQPGYHVFSVLGTDAQGNIRSSQPVLVVVRK